MGTTARLIYADSEGDADLFYLTRFLAGDPFLYVEQGGMKTLLLSDLEIDRGRREASVDEDAIPIRVDRPYIKPIVDFFWRRERRW